MVDLSIPTPYYVELAREAALTRSACVRGRFGAVILDEDGNYVVGANVRIGKCCDGNICVRNHLKIQHVERIEVGAEIHAEQAALVQWQRRPNVHSWFILAGMTSTGIPYDGFGNLPCHMCAMLIKFAGFTNIWLPFGEEPRSISISGVIARLEQRYDG